MVVERIKRKENKIGQREKRVHQTPGARKGAGKERGKTILEIKRETRTNLSLDHKELECRQRKRRWTARKSKYKSKWPRRNKYEGRRPRNTNTTGGSGTNGRSRRSTGQSTKGSKPNWKRGPKRAGSCGGIDGNTTDGSGEATATADGNCTTKKRNQ